MIKEVIISIVLAYLLCQTSKTIIHKVRTRKWDWKVFILQNGGMPSTHTSTTVALSCALLFETGLSYEFIIAALFTLIVMNDAMKVRRETGEEAGVLNEIIAKENLLHKKLTIMVGHTPLQVAVGLIVGVVITLIVYTI